MKDEIKVTFTVAMDAEQKKLKNTTDVTLRVVFPEGCENQVQQDAMAHMVVKYQNQIRSNWTTFVEKGLPEEITYGDPLYGRKQTSRAPTKEEVEKGATEMIGRLNPDGIAELVRTGSIPSGDEFYK